MSAYYNEIDPYAAEWLRNLIAAGLIAPGDVDTRSIADVCPADLVGYTQCHFFAGIGVWSSALRGAGWPDDRPVWTGSCPCQPFSAAGRGEGFADERHLWPAWFHLISQRGPSVVFGEQVASKAVDPWIDLVQADMEAVGYAFGAVAFPSAGVGAPHIRDRTYFVADAGRARGQRRADAEGFDGFDARERHESAGDNQSRGDADRMADADHDGQHQAWRAAGPRGQIAGRSRNGATFGLADAKGHRYERAGQLGEPSGRNGAPHGGAACDSANGRSGASGHIAEAKWGEYHQPWPGPTNGFWRDPDWLFCRDGKWRPVEPGTSPLAHGARSRVGRLRAYGNAINQKAAEAFIASYASDGISLTPVSAISDNPPQGAFA